MSHRVTQNAFRLRRPLASWLADRRGVAAVEFALIVPLMLSMYLITMEVGQAIEANKKVSRLGSMVADLVTQQQTVAKAEIDAILKIAEATLQPYARTKPAIEVTAIEITDEETPQVKVVWSRKMVNGATMAGETPGSATTVPEKLKVKGSFLVRVASGLEYQPVITYTAGQKSTLGLAAAFDGISMKETYHLRPRMSSTIACPDC